LINFGQAVNFPLIVSGIVAGFGAATLLHLLTVSVSRRRRELASLKVIGFVNRQLVMTVAWQSIAVAFLGLAVGVPLGIVAGRTVWVAFARNLGVVPVARIPVLALVGLAAGILLAVMAIAVAPALAAKRARTGPPLRSP
jgi:ABC-type antimicrobial peptide transport system permease subunit